MSDIYESEPELEVKVIVRSPCGTYDQYDHKICGHSFDCKYYFTCRRCAKRFGSQYDLSCHDCNYDKYLKSDK